MKKKQKKQKAENFRFVIGLFFVFLFSFFLISFVSYFNTWKSDQSILDSGGEDFLFNSQVVVKNWAGKLGASVSNLFIHKWFGLSAYLLNFILLFIGLRLLKIKSLNINNLTKYIIILSLWFSVVLEFFFSNDSFYLGGYYGYFITVWLESIIGKFGTFIFISLFIVTFIIFGVKDSLSWFQKNFKKFKLVINKQKYSISTQKIEKDQSFETDTNSQELEYKQEKNKEGNFNNNIELNIKNTIRHKKQIASDNELSDDFEDSGLTVNKTIAEEQVEQTNEIANLTKDDFDPKADLSNYKFPPISLLQDHKIDKEVTEEELHKELIKNNNKIIETLRHYKIEIDKIEATVGPTVTLYEIIPAPGIRISKIKNLEDDIALSLAALGIRIIAPIPGKGTIGIEVPNQNPEVVSMKSVIASKKFQNNKFELPIVLGKTISNATFVVDLAKMPHLLVAGATGQGKSVGLNAILISLLYKKHPAELKFVMIDPKKVELSIYSVIEKHYLAKQPDADEPIITETDKVIHTIKSLNVEMDSRYDLLKIAKCRNLKEYNRKFLSRKLNPNNGHKFMPYIVLVIDEFADLIMTAGKEIEVPISRIAQLARAVGIHAIIATQRPTTNIITGTIKANFPARISFKVTTSIDSKTILDTTGANQLIGRGDMIISTGNEMTRLQCAFIDTPEIEEIVDFISKQQSYPSAFILPEFVEESDTSNRDVDLSKKDTLFEDAARTIVINQQGSTSMIQRKLSIGYNRAGRIIDQLEAAGIVGPFEGSKAREVLVPDEYALEKMLKNLRD